jgi:undecaprenyl diphosphate synthase
MDWNRRWAKERFLPAIVWHKYWADNVETITNIAWDRGVKYITLWWLSTENLEKRSKEEVEWIIKLVNNVENYLEKMIKRGLKFETIWDISKLPEKSQLILKKVKEQTKNNTWIVLTLALVYWWQDEIIRWVKKYLEKWWDIENLSTTNFRQYLDTSILPVPDVIIRTWWDIRHSWFLLYDSAYSEYYFTEKKWPEFDENELNKVIDFFENSKRNFWK